ncbi:unnamed protein product [Closterium sp. Yama58-4]|nr:unnamed protein product [Closterium sp. Yama58-4]
MVHPTAALSPQLRISVALCVSRARRTLLSPQPAGSGWLPAANSGSLVATIADRKIRVSYFQIPRTLLQSGAGTLDKRQPCAMAHGGEGFGKVGAEGVGFITQQPERAESRQADDSAELSRLDRTSSGASVDSNGSRSSHGGSSLVVISFYKFAQLDDCAALKRPLDHVCRQHRVSGGVIVAREGINGSICGTPDAAEAVIEWLRADARLAGLRTTVQPAGAEEREAHRAAEAMEAEERGEGGVEAEAVDGQSECSPLAAGRDAPFRWNHVRVKVKQESALNPIPPSSHATSFPSSLPSSPPSPISPLLSPSSPFRRHWYCGEQIVTLGMPEVNPAEGVGTYVVVDVRNDYETRIGAFHRATDPNTRSFRQFPAWVQDHLPLPPSPPNSPAPHSPSSASSASTTPPDSASSSEPSPAFPPASPSSADSLPRVAMYCTGGIRCEKATAYMLHLGFPQERVFHLDGGILRYLAEVPPEDSLWRGECFVFDKRVAVGHGMLPTSTYSLCYACQQPVDDADRQSPLWEAGVSCPHCHGSKSAEEKERARARQRQFERWGAVGGPGGEKAERAAERMRRRAERRKGGETGVCCFTIPSFKEWASKVDDRMVCKQKAICPISFCCGN